MPIPEKTTLYHEKTLLDRTIDTVATQNKPIGAADLNKVIVAAQIQEGIDKYRAKAATLSTIALQEEKHNSARLALHLEQTGQKRPPKCHAHAIVAGNHRYCADLRLIMAKLKIRIDDPDNGCWLPENNAATPHPAFPKAPPHSRIHRSNYYFWINTHLINIIKEPIFRARLKLIARQLQQGNHPSYVMLAKGVGLPQGQKP